MARGCVLDRESSKLSFESGGKEESQAVRDESPFEAESIFFLETVFLEEKNVLMLIRAASMVWNILGEWEMM